MAKNRHEMETNEIKPGQWLRMLREYRDVSREKLESAIGIAEETIIKWEGGKSVPRTESIKPVLKHLGVPDELIENHVRWFRNLPPLQIDWQPWMPWESSKKPPQPPVEPIIVNPPPADEPEPTIPLSRHVILILSGLLIALGIIVLYFYFSTTPAEMLVIPYIHTANNFKLDGNCDKYTTALTKQFSNHKGMPSTTRLVARHSDFTESLLSVIL